MTQYNSVHVKSSYSQLEKLKSATKNGTGLILRLARNMIGGNETEAFYYQLVAKFKYL